MTIYHQIFNVLQNLHQAESSITNLINGFSCIQPLTITDIVEELSCFIKKFYNFCCRLTFYICVVAFQLCVCTKHSFNKIWILPPILITRVADITLNRDVDREFHLITEILKPFLFTRRWGPGRPVCSHHHNLLLLPLPGHHPGVALYVCEGGPGVREGGHLQAGKAEGRGSEGTRPVLHHALHWHLQEGRPQDSQLWCSSTRGVLYNANNILI